MNMKLHNKAHRERKRENDRAAYHRYVRDPEFRQMRADCKRLGLSRAEWRRQVAQGLIEVNNGRQ